MRAMQEVMLGMIAALCGLAVWLVIATTSGLQEAWDSPDYFLTGIPVMLLTAIVCGFVQPRMPWRWGIAVVILQPVELFSHGNIGAFVLVGFGTFASIAVVCVIAAYGGAAMKHLIDRRKPKS